MLPIKTRMPSTTTAPPFTTTSFSEISSSVEPETVTRPVCKDCKSSNTTMILFVTIYIIVSVRKK